MAVFERSDIWLLDMNIGIALYALREEIQVDADRDEFAQEEFSEVETVQSYCNRHFELVCAFRENHGTLMSDGLVI